MFELVCHLKKLKLHFLVLIYAPVNIATLVYKKNFFNGQSSKNKHSIFTSKLIIFTGGNSMDFLNPFYPEQSVKFATCVPNVIWEARHIF